LGRMYWERMVFSSWDPFNRSKSTSILRLCQFEEELDCRFRGVFLY
jgi:hypothetical protein